MRISSRAVTSPPTPSASVAASTSSAYLWWAMMSIVLGGYISVLTSHIMNMVLPKMMNDLGTDVITIRWVVTSYMMANAVVMPLSAWLARTLGARDLYIGCLCVFIGSTVACGMATSVPMIVTFRVIQGASGGLIMPVSMLLMLDLYPAEKRGLGTSIWSMGASCWLPHRYSSGRLCGGASELARSLLPDPAGRCNRPVYCLFHHAQIPTGAWHPL